MHVVIEVIEICTLSSFVLSSKLCWLLLCLIPPLVPCRSLLVRVWCSVLLQRLWHTAYVDLCAALNTFYCLWILKVFNHHSLIYHLCLLSLTDRSRCRPKISFCCPQVFMKVQFSELTDLQKGFYYFSNEHVSFLWCKPGR